MFARAFAMFIGVFVFSLFSAPAAIKRMLNFNNPLPKSQATHEPTWKVLLVMCSPSSCTLYTCFAHVCDDLDNCTNVLTLRNLYAQTMRVYQPGGVLRLIILCSLNVCDTAGSGV